MALLELRDLQKHYPSPEGGRSTVLDVPEFTLQAGEQVALEGVSERGVRDSTEEQRVGAAARNPRARVRRSADRASTCWPSEELSP